MHLTLAALLALSVLRASATPHMPRSAPVPIPLAKRAPFAADGVVDAGALRAHLAQVQAKISRGFDNFAKNTGAKHPNDKRVLRKRGLGIDPLTDDQEQLWFGTINVGTPPKPFTVDFDTGSSDLFLPSPACTANCEGHKMYNTNASRTAVPLNRPFEIGFGDGSSVQGELFADTVTIAGLTATNQTLAAATQYSDGFALDEFPPDGLMGMAFPQIAASDSSPVFQTLVAEHRTDQPVFAFKLADSGSELVVGGVDHTKFNGPFTLVDITTVGFWQVTLGAVGLGQKTIATQLTSIIDTGTTLIIGDVANVEKFYAAIPGSVNASATLGDGLFTYPCKEKINASLTFAGRKFIIPDEIFNAGQVSPGSSDCIGGIVTLADLPDFWVVGDTFLRTVYTLFDVGNTQVGFATLR